MSTRIRLAVSGVVQGVGFRPFVFALAQKLALAGFVGNDSAGAFVEIEGPDAALAQFERELVDHPPPLAHIETLNKLTLPTLGDHGFRIAESVQTSGANTLVSPDIATCQDCLHELFDPADRRYRYPFINCTHCGPRFTITRDVPYDRPLTTMAAFPLCADCACEYTDPSDRRFHAQPIACPVCGPHVWLQTAESATPLATHDAAIRTAQQALRAGKIVAVKGIGGIHLVCDATNAAAVGRLRTRKRRGDKPLALMCGTLDAARAIAQVSLDEAALLTSRARPIVILKRGAATDLPDALAPGTATLGVMLPYSPLHALLIENMPPLVMTSGNFCDVPISKDNAEALGALREIADLFLLHDRDIHVSCDDSVLRVVDHIELPIRRSRGYAPFPIQLPASQAAVLATGGELKAALCLTRDRHAFMSQHIGDMATLETLAAFDVARAHLQRLFRVVPEIVACDKHPGYLSTLWAARYATQHQLPLFRVQHHHAHIAAVMAENGHTGSAAVIGVCFDGTGFGDDGAIWGGEFLIADYTQYRRAAHLAYAPLPGGDAAIKRPYRQALAQLFSADIAWDQRLSCVAACPDSEKRILKQQLQAGVNCILTSSMGRLFDVAASLMGVQQHAGYEAQAAIEMESLAADHVHETYRFELLPDNTISARPVLHAIITDVLMGICRSVMAAKFHNAVAACIVDVCVRLRESGLHNTVALSGGVFQNTRLLQLALCRLRANGFIVLTHSSVPPNDGGLALGQAVIAAHHFER